MAGIEWFRWHHGSVNDPKFGLVAKRAGARVAEVIAVWAALLEAASAAEDRGAIGPVDFEALDFALDMDDGTAQRIYERMCERNLVEQETGRVVSWEKRQPKRERDEEASSTKRVREHRDRKHQDAQRNASRGDETPRNANETQETPRVEESNTPHTPHGGQDPADHAEDAEPEDGADSKPKRSTPVGLKSWLDAVRAAGEKPIPEGHSVFAYAEEVGLPRDLLLLAWLEFKRRYSQPGSKRYRDWRAVFRKSVEGNWLKLWRIDGDAYVLTTVGLQAQRLHHAEAA